jgi:hypothetical protein
VKHDGTPKPFVLRDHWGEFAQWHDQIEYVTTTDDYGSFWGREQAQRNIGMGYLLANCADEDVLAVSDIDEFIPRDSFGKFAASGLETAGLVQKLRFAAVDWDGSPGVTAVLARASVITGAKYTCDTLRQAREGFSRMEPGGYHFSWFGGPERIRDKARCSPHQEHLDRNLELAGGYMWERGLGGMPEPGSTVTGNVAEIADDYPEQVRTRECPWYFWRPGPDGLPLDEEAREREVAYRASTPLAEGACAEGRKVYVAGISAWHPEDGTPCPSAVA